MNYLCKYLRAILVIILQLGLILPSGYGVPARNVHKSASSSRLKPVLGHNRHKQPQKLTTPKVHKQATKNYMQGYASFYADKFNGRKMANGDVYLPYVYSAAHAKLPLGTKLKITNITPDANYGKVLYVEVTDRMSSRPKYIIDLSPVAARYLNGTGRGLKVKLTIVSNKEFDANDMNEMEDSEMEDPDE